jgi:hypothetical protein
MPEGRTEAQQQVPTGEGTSDDDGTLRAEVVVIALAGGFVAVVVVFLDFDFGKLFQHAFGAGLHVGAERGSQIVVPDGGFPAAIGLAAIAVFLVLLLSELLPFFRSP